MIPVPIISCILTTKVTMWQSLILIEGFAFNVYIIQSHV